MTKKYILILSVILVILVYASSIIFSRFKVDAASDFVSLQNGKLYVNGQEFKVKGVNYNPSAIGSDQLDLTAPQYDIPKIAQLQANTLGTYNVGKFEWSQWSDLTNGEQFYDKISPLAESYNLKIIVGYFSNQTIDWTNATRVSKATAQYKELVLKTKDRPSTLIYLLGNEIFEKLPSDSQKIAYAKWLGLMADWTHSVDPSHPTTYADNASQEALAMLKQYAPNLDIYSINDYEWGTATELSDTLALDHNLWPDKPILLHEWGTDSWNAPSWTEDETAQATQVKKLVAIIDQVYANSSPDFIGSVFFEYSDQWNKIGSSSTQDPDQGWPWTCNTCFDKRGNEDYWGLTRSIEANQAGQRVLKQAYTALKQAWSGETVPTATPRPSRRKH
jgi:hypothetical protein